MVSNVMARVYMGWLGLIILWAIVGQIAGFPIDGGWQDKVTKGLVGGFALLGFLWTIFLAKFLWFITIPLFLFTAYWMVAKWVMGVGDEDLPD